MGLDTTEVAAKFLTPSEIRIARNLRRLRERARLSLDEAAYLIGGEVDRHEVRRMELGVRTGRSPSLIVLALAYGVSITELTEEVNGATRA